ncbi:hypothetical protein A8F92_02300 [Escherichia coli]|nr:hypothetical protein A8F92_02300 [Escherichia coli]
MLAGDRVKPANQRSFLFILLQSTVRCFSGKRKFRHQKLFSEVDKSSGELLILTLNIEITGPRLDMDNDFKIWLGIIHSFARHNVIGNKVELPL